MCSVSQVLSHSEKGSGGHSGEVKFDLVDIAPAPILPRFERFDDRVLGRMKMLGRVLVLRRIAATHVPARQAQAQVYPAIAHLQTFLAAAGMWLDVSNLILMRASCHDFLLRPIFAPYLVAP
jgi:hypothetical protein